MSDETSVVDLKTPFDDDSHTFQDGPLQRYFRMRKWFVLSGFTLILLDTNWLNYRALTTSMLLPQLPKDIVHSTVTASAIYLLLQAALVTVQLWQTYGDHLAARLSLLRTSALDDLDRAIAQVVKRREQTKEELRSLNADPHKNEPILTGEENVIARIKVLRTALKQENIEFKDLFLRSTMMQRRYESRRSIIQASEIALDFLRIVPPFAILLYAAVTHGSLATFLPT